MVIGQVSRAWGGECLGQKKSISRVRGHDSQKEIRTVPMTLSNLHTRTTIKGL